VEYHKYVAKLEVALDRYTHSCCRILYCWNHRQKGDDKGCDAVHERMEVEYYCAQLQYHHLAVVRLICMLSFLWGRERGEWCKCQCRSISLSSKDTVDEDLCFVSKMTCRNNVNKYHNSPLATHTIRSRQSSEKLHLDWLFPKRGPTTLVGFRSSFFTHL